MEVLLKGGVTVDIASCQDLDRHHERMRDMLPIRQEADYVPIFGSVTAPAAPTTIVLPFNPKAPSNGKMWAMQWISIFTTGFSGVIPNLTAAVCIGNQPPPSTNAKVNPSDITYPANNIPGTIAIPDKMLVRPSEQLYILLSGSGLVAGTVYNATGAVLEADMGREANLFI